MNSQVLKLALVIVLVSAGLALTGSVVGVVFGFVILLALFEPAEHNTKFAAAIVGGFLLDIYSTKPFGFWSLLLVTSVFLIQTLVANYVRTPTFKRI